MEIPSGPGERQLEEEDRTLNSSSRVNGEVWGSNGDVLEGKRGPWFGRARAS